MKNEQLNRILKLVDKTGDKFIVLDKDTDRAFAILDLEDYELMHDDAYDLESDFDDEDDMDEGTDPLTGLSEEELFEKIDDDITRWKQANGINDDYGKDFEDHTKEVEPEEIKNGDLPAVDTGNLPKNSEKSEEIKIEELTEIRDESLPLVDNVIDEEPLDDLPEDDVEEDKFYIEPLE